MEKFIYVFNIEDKEVLLGLGYNLLKEDMDKDIYIFLNKETLTFDKTTVRYALSNMLTF